MFEIDSNMHKLTKKTSGKTDANCGKASSLEIETCCDILMFF